MATNKTKQIFNPLSGSFDTISDLSALLASDIPYDNSVTGLTATDVQAAIDELKFTPTQTIFVDATNGDDTTGTGGVLSPVKTLNKAVTLVTNPSVLYTIQLSSGNYSGPTISWPRNAHLVGSGASSVSNRIEYIAAPGDNAFFEFRQLGIDEVYFDFTNASIALPVLSDGAFSIERVDTLGTGPWAVRVFDSTLGNCTFSGNNLLSNCLFVSTCLVKSIGTLICSDCTIGIQMDMEPGARVQVNGCTVPGAIVATGTSPSLPVVYTDASSLTQATLVDIDVQLSDLSSRVQYDNTTSGLTSETVQDAIDELTNEIASLPNPIVYKGTWDASTNSPTLSNSDTSVEGFLYQVTVAGTVDFGAGNISFEVGDKVVNNGTEWQKWDMTDAVLSVNGQTGIVSLDSDDIPEGSTNLYYNDDLIAKYVGGIDAASNTMLAPGVDTQVFSNSPRFIWGTFASDQIIRLPDPASGIENGATYIISALDKTGTITVYSNPAGSSTVVVIPAGGWAVISQMGSDESNWRVISTSENSVSWGSITGSLFSQTDLQSALDTKANTMLSNLSATAINAALNPVADDTYSIGTSSERWANVRALTHDGVNHTARDPSNNQLGIFGWAPASTPAGNTIGLRAYSIFNNGFGIFTDTDTDNNSAATGGLFLETGNKTDGTGNSGDIKVQTGTSVGGLRGIVSLNGRYIDATSKQIQNVQDPTSAQHAATKNYVDTRVLNDLSDVVITSPMTNQLLQYNGTNWVNATISMTPAWGSITGTLSDQTDLQSALDGKASTTLNNLGSTSINANLFPSATNVRDLGGSTLRWATLYTTNVNATTGNVSATSLTWSGFINWSGGFLTSSGTSPSGLSFGASNLGAILRTTHNATTQNGVLVFSENVTSTNGIDTGYIGIETGNKSNVVAGGNTGFIRIKTGDKAGTTGNSGDISLITGTPGSGGTRGIITLNARLVDASSTRIINVATPTSGNDATNKTYVDGLVGTKPSVLGEVGSGQNIAAGDTALLDLLSTTFNNGSMTWDDTNRVVKVPSAGEYNGTLSLKFTVTDVGAAIEVRINKNGNPIKYSYGTYNSYTNEKDFEMNFQLMMTTSDELSVEIVNYDGSNAIDVFNDSLVNQLYLGKK